MNINPPVIQSCFPRTHYAIYLKTVLCVTFLLFFSTLLCANDQEDLNAISKGLTPVELTVKKSAPLILADQGKACAAIVIPKNSSEHYYYKQIAKFLKSYLDKVTGANFIITDDSSKFPTAIYLGPCELKETDKIFKQAQKGKYGSFQIVCIENGVVLAGKDLCCPHLPETKLLIGNKSQSRGTFFAAIDFLERLIGVRFYFPGELGTYIPDFRKKQLTIPAVEYSDSPIFPYRGSSYGYARTMDNDAIRADKKTKLFWQDLMRIEDVNLQKTGHTDIYWHERFGQSHPEFFAMRKNGTRMTGKEGQLSSQRCYTSKAGLEEHIKLIEEYYEKGENWRMFGWRRNAPNKKYIKWFPNDGFVGCYCKECLKLTDTDAPSDRKHSRLIWEYAKKLALRIKQKWPDKILQLSPYHSYSHIPDNIDLPGNISMFAIMPPNAYIKEKVYRELAQKQLDTYAKYSDGRVIIWNHYPHSPRIGNRIKTPYPIPHYLADFFRINQKKITGVYLNGYSSFSYALDGLILYLYFKILWNPNIDVDACIQDYCERLYGPASNEVKKYFDTIISRWENTKWPNLPTEGRYEKKIPSKYYWELTYTRDIRNQLKEILELALKKTAPGSLYFERMKHLQEANQAFFDQGHFFDLGNQAQSKCLRITPKLDGKLDEWNAFKKLSLKNNDTGKLEKIKSDFFTGYDDKNFYIAGNIFEEGAFKTKGKKQARDSALWRHDSIEIYLCTANPSIKAAGLDIGKQYHQIIIDSDGSIFDGYKTMGKKGLDKKVNIQFTHKIQKHDKGFSFEMAIPFKSLNLDTPTPGTMWYVNFYRNRPRSGGTVERFAWSPTMGSFADTSRFGFLEFPHPILWKSDFSEIIKNLKIPQKENVQISAEEKDGILKLHVKANEKLKEPVEVKFNLPMSTPVTFKGAALFEWAFRFKGEGLQRVRIHAQDMETKNSLNHWFFNRTSQSKSAGWIIGQIDDNTPKKPWKKQDKINIPLKRVDCLFFALKVSPGADFIFEVKNIKISEKI
jgi:uncharacterized protein DUF4838/cellulose/xylan binding protein with CBM9 domain